ncbi:hypothetical protein FBY21_0677 [Pseudomonas sp. SLBN-26]|uniref:hypothetical protein n=1 Tax=Pseudomonadaceae TaxID=135621 RepID=UPI00114DA377|nr:MULTISPECIES: hypothetical protein [Pseudomonas]MCP1616063.1 hypothetical protein [Pseudomonas otitidis]TQL05329.1 hypothetical protein FBY21_0677 [Pseudomonas sp. SLBN-26]
MYKLEHQVDGNWAQFSHPARFSRPVVDAHPRLVVGVPGSDPDVILRLVRCLEAPLILLYVLHTPRGEAEPARYQSPELSLPEVESFIHEFGLFLSQDSRFDLWVHSPAQQATLVWDRHDLIHAYGPLAEYVAALNGLGFSEGDVQIPIPHAHHYHPEHDETARSVMAWCDWWASPLRPEDEQ